MNERLGTKACRLADDAHEELRQLIDTTPALFILGGPTVISTILTVAG